MHQRMCEKRESESERAGARTFRSCLIIDQRVCIRVCEPWVDVCVCACSAPRGGDQILGGFEREGHFVRARLTERVRLGEESFVMLRYAVLNDV